MGRVFLTADLHFGHTDILKYEKRPFVDTDIMDKTLVSNWNSVVSQHDIVYVLGDASFHGKDETSRLIHSLHGKKILIMGNHDKGRSIKWWVDCGFAEVCRYPILYNNFFLFHHEPPQYIPADTPYIYFYGHVHSSEMYSTITKQTACVCVERWGYKPIELNKLIEYMQCGKIIEKS